LPRFSTRACRLKNWQQLTISCLKASLISRSLLRPRSIGCVKTSPLGHHFGLEAVFAPTASAVRCALDETRDEALEPREAHPPQVRLRIVAVEDVHDGPALRRAIVRPHTWGR
jgi:hypothetical protein